MKCYKMKFDLIEDSYNVHVNLAQLILYDICIYKAQNSKHITYSV